MAKRNKKSKKPNYSGSKHCTLHVDGMHCASCELLIEKKLLKQEGVELVDATLANGKVLVQYTGDKPDVDSLNSDFQDLGYRFSEKVFPKKKDTPLIGFGKSGELQLNPRKALKLLQSTGIVILLLLGFLLLERSNLAASVSVTSDSPVAMFFLFGLVAGVSSCAALIGGLLLSMAKNWNEMYIAESNKTKAQPHILFHVGRLLSFFVFGGVLGVIGEQLSFSLEFTAAITIAVSALMALLALQMLTKWSTSIRIGLPKFVGRFAANDEVVGGRYTPFLTGVLTFLLPCGFTLVAQTLALSAGGFLQGALIMLFFALGTMVTLVVISISSIRFNSKPHLTAQFNKIAGILVLFFALYNFNSQLNLLGLPSLSDIDFSAPETQPQAVAQVDPNGQQTLDVVAQNFEYVPTSSTVLTTGVPTVMRVDNKGVQGCGAFMAARGLFDGFINLKPGINEISFTPQAGIYKLTCTMGMVPPVTITVV